MATYLLVHGAWHGAWVWERVTPLLTSRGHTVYARDLPGHGADPTPVGQVTLQDYTESVCDVLTSLAGQRVILVGHSMAGVVITQVAERMPEQVRCLVYVAAFLLQSGQRMVDVQQQGNGPSQAVQSQQLTADGRASVIPSDRARAIFYSQCSPAEADWAVTRIGPEPLQIRQTPVYWTPERFGQVPRVYVECTEDQAIRLSLQRRMHQAVSCHRVLTLAADHTPMLSAPEALAEVLDLLDANW
ncbi:MAG: alpha/beta fold hydrolase [Alicyclobacillus sp.]|nr:alpha/beta fold hydrolase [Alicyclobacillus sp.]